MDNPTESPDWSALANASYKTVSAAIAELEQLLRTYDPLEIISRVAVFIISGPAEILETETPEKNEVHLEYLISLATANSFPVGAKFPTSDAIQSVIDLLTKIHFSASAFYIINERSNSESRDLLEEAAAHFRIDKLHVRGDAYWPHLREVMVNLLEPHDKKLREALGFTSVEFFELMERTERFLEDRLTKEMEEKVKPYSDLMRRWMPAMTEDGNIDEAASERFKDFLRENEAIVASAKEKFDSFGTPNAFVIRAKTEAEKTILHLLSCCFGDNLSFRGQRPEQSFWPLNESLTSSKPIIKHDGVYYAFHTPAILRGAHLLVGELLRVADPVYWETKFLKARGDYLEKETARLFGKALPNAKVLTSAFYDLPTDGKTTESDIVITCDDFLIIVECKASALPDATRRGGVKSTEASLRRTIVGGLNQAERLVTEMTRAGSVTLRPKEGGETVLRVEDFRWVLRVNVTLELMSPVATTLWKLIDNEMIAHPERCWSVALYDLKVIVEVLDSPAIFLHYLIRRLDLNVLQSVQAGDELDYLMHYVESGLFFREGNQPEPNTHVMLARHTIKLDQYYRRIQGIDSAGKKPKPRLGKKTKQMLEFLQRVRPPHYLTASIELLEFDIPDREELLGKSSEHLARLRENGAAYALSFTANSQSKSGIVLAASRNPAEVQDILTGRLIQHCRENQLDELLVILLGVPLGSPSALIFIVDAASTVGERGARLLNQLKFEVTERRLVDR